MLIKNGPLVPTKVLEDGKKVPKEPREFDAEDYKKMEKNAKAKKLLYFGNKSSVFVFKYDICEFCLLPSMPAVDLLIRGAG